MSGLPDGRRGQLVAAGLLVVMLSLLWLAAVGPLLDWHDARGEWLAQRREMLAHMTQIAATLPALRLQAGQTGSGPPVTALLGGDTDAIAGATLQGAIQDMATSLGATLASAEALPGEQQGAFRGVALRVTLRGDWSTVMAMLRAIDESPLRLLVDDLQLHATAQPQHAGPAPLEASLTVLGFRPGRGSQPGGTQGDLRADTGTP